MSDSPDDTAPALDSLTCGDRTIRYRFTPASTPNRPILMIFHGQAYGAQPARFTSERWNVVCPLDTHGAEGLGSWFLGERGDFFWLEAIPTLLERVRSVSGTGRLFTWGSSMGGYAALLHGTLNRADSIYANLPQTWLLGSKYANNGSAKYFEPLFGETVDERYNDLRHLITTRSRTKYFLCFNQLEGSDYFMEQGLPFISHLTRLRIKTYAEIRPLAAHGQNHSISESLALFARYRDA